MQLPVGEVLEVLRVVVREAVEAQLHQPFSQSRSALSFTATTWSQTEVVERAPLLAYLRQLPKSVQRVKGFVRTPDGLLEVHRVDTRVAAQLRLDLSHKPPPLGLVFIGYQPEDLPQRAPSF